MLSGYLEISIHIFESVLMKQKVICVAFPGIAWLWVFLSQALNHLEEKKIWFVQG